jgi:hypothetical protein
MNKIQVIKQGSFEVPTQFSECLQVTYKEYANNGGTMMLHNMYFFMH